MDDNEKMKPYLVRHPAHGEITVNGRRKYDAVIAAAKKWGVPWSKIARECEYIVLAEEERKAGTEQ